MAQLIDPAGTITAVHSRHMIGRSRTMHTTIERAEVSAQHAVLSWMGTHWAIRDLSSRNGTLVGGERIKAGVDVALKAGDKLSFGSRFKPMTLISDEPPGPFAECGALLTMGEGQVLALPTVNDPVALIHFEPQTGWVAAHNDRVESVQNGDTLSVNGQTWTLALPETLAATADLRGTPLRLREVSMQFRVSADEEFVELTIALPTGRHLLPPRAYHYPLLVLARHRLRDAEAGFSLDERGWLYTADLQKMLRLTGNRINLSIFRSRRELEGLGVADAQGLVERRPTTQQLRLGVGRVTVQAL